MVREVAVKAARGIVNRAASLQALRRRAGSATPLASLLAATPPAKDGSFGVEASVRRADGACFLVQARLNKAGEIEAFTGSEI